MLDAEQPQKRRPDKQELPTMDDATYTYAPLADEMRRLPDVYAFFDPHDCTADCFSASERMADPTIDQHFNDRGPHECIAAHETGDR